MITQARRGEGFGGGGGGAVLGGGGGASGASSGVLAYERWGVEEKKGTVAKDERGSGCSETSSRGIVLFCVLVDHACTFP